ncbi:hypothetical protein COM45_03055 [Corynebacterium accolens]|uniref:Bacteriocin biosynthesis cyclodehydratase n=1 Tax=Corynebacterium accolens TaxID=38284 RepID=A0A2A4ALL0_9CORY|nr:hypothetical protein COM45_03055 [Corynebacterium accolens]
MPVASQEQSTTAYMLAPGVSILEREPGVIQFGMDATRVGVVEVESGIIASLSRLHQPITRDSIQRLLTRAGMEETAASSLIEDLICYNILWPEPARSCVVVLGKSPLAEAIRTAASQDGFVLRKQLEQENTYSYIKAVSPHFPVVAVDFLDKPVELAEALRKCKGDFLPVSMFDARGVIGPLRTAGRGPCPMCSHLHRIDGDEQWHNVVAQLDAADAKADEVIIKAVAMQTMIFLRRLAGRPSPPGAKSSRVIQGELLEVDPYGHNQYRLVLEHPKCPYCFERSQRH